VNKCMISYSLLFWTFWPMIVTLLYLLVREKQITSKRKFFFLGSLIGYILIIGNSITHNFLKQHFEDIDAILTIIARILVILLPVLVNYLLLRRFKI